MDMMLTNRGSFQKSPSFENVIHSNQAVYEVIRILDGIPLFLEEHFARLVNSMQFQGWKLEMGFDEFRTKIYQLIKLNRRECGNIRFEYYLYGNKNSWAFSFIPHSYPTAEDYLNGVSTDLLFDERKNPNAKVVQSEIRERSNQMITNQHLYEVLLVNRNGVITEGSRSNVFFIKDEIFYTAPYSMVLVGITRQKVIECLKHLKLSIVEDAISISQLDNFDAAFLTGTSPKVLPISSIGNLQFETQLLVLQKLMKSYGKLIDDYIKTH
jgi:branched-chain amino acid aminotransferase